MFYLFLSLLLLFVAIYIISQVFTIIMGFFFDYSFLFGITMMITGNISVMLGAEFLGILNTLILIPSLIYVYLKYSSWRKNNVGTLLYNLVTLHTAIFGTFKLTGIFRDLSGSTYLRFPYMGDFMLELFGTGITFIKLSRFNLINTVLNIVLLFIIGIIIYNTRVGLDTKVASKVNIFD